MGKNVENVAAS